MLPRPTLLFALSALTLTLTLPAPLFGASGTPSTAPASSESDPVEAQSLDAPAHDDGASTEDDTLAAPVSEMGLEHQSSDRMQVLYDKGRRRHKFGLLSTGVGLVTVAGGTLLFQKGFEEPGAALLLGSALPLGAGVAYSGLGPLQMGRALNVSGVKARQTLGWVGLIAPPLLQLSWILFNTTEDRGLSQPVLWGVSAGITIGGGALSHAQYRLNVASYGERTSLPFIPERARKLDRSEKSRKIFGIAMITGGLAFSTAGIISMATNSSTSGPGGAAYYLVDQALYSSVIVGGAAMVYVGLNNLKTVYDLSPGKQEVKVAMAPLIRRDTLGFGLSGSF